MTFIFLSINLSNYLLLYRCLFIYLIQWFPGEGVGAHFTAADLVRSVNKTVRQNYIKRRLKVKIKKKLCRAIGAQYSFLYYIFYGRSDGQSNLLRSLRA